MNSKYTSEQIMAAKKIITIQMEIDGEMVTETHDGTEGLVVITAGEEHTSATILASGEDMGHFATVMLKEIADRCPLILIPIIMNAIGQAEKQDKVACH